MKYLKIFEEFSDEIVNMFLDKPLIVIAEVNVIMKKQPIGYYFDKDLWEPGRYFDKLIESGEGGVFMDKIQSIVELEKQNKYFTPVQNF
jgi:hypothetical protein